MRNSALRGVIGAVFCVLIISLAHAEARPDWYPGDEAIAARTKLVQEQRKAARAYYQREFVDQYQKIGLHAPTWDQLALDLINARIDLRIGGNDDAFNQQRVAANKCTTVKPEDRLVYYLWACARRGSSMPEDSQRTVMAYGSKGIVESQYRGSLRFHALMQYAESCATGPSGEKKPPDMAVVEDRLKQALTLLDELAKDKDLPPCEMNAMLHNAGLVSLTLYNDRWQWASRVYDVLVRNKGETSELLTAKGGLFTSSAWDARGNGWGSTVTEEGWRLMQDRLAVAEKDLTRAWEMDPKNAEAAIQMLKVELGQAKGKDVMEMWFRRAVAIDPTDERPYEAKRYYLEPKWHGSEEEILGFAREVAAMLPKTSSIRMILWKAHHAIAKYEAGEDTTEAQRAYYKKHPQAWPEIKAVADDVVPANQTANYYKTHMVRAAVAAGDLASARTYAAVTDEKLAWAQIGPEYLQLKAAANAEP